MTSTSEPKFIGERAKREAYGFRSKFPYFLKKMTATCVNPCVVTIPTHFAKMYVQKSERMLLQNEKGKSWSVKLNSRRSGQTFLDGGKRGWKVFARKNHIKLGDYCVFELVKKNVMQVYIYRCSSMSTGEEQLADTETFQILNNGRRSRALEDPPCKKSWQRIDEADMKFDRGSGEDSGFSKNWVSHGGSSSLSRGAASLSSSDGSCFIVEGSRHSSVPESSLGGPSASLMAGSPARVKSKCKKTCEGSNEGHSGPTTRAASRLQAETSSVRGAVPTSGVGVQGVDIGSQAPEVVGVSVAGAAPWCDMGATMVGTKDGEGPKASPRMVMSYDLEMVEGFPVRACYAGLYQRICSRHGHLASSANIKLMPMLVVASVTQALEVIVEIEACAENELSLGRISDWETCLGTVEAVGLRVGWVQSRLKELNGIVSRMDLVKEARVVVPRLAKNVESAKAAYEAAEVKLAEAESAMAANDRVLNQADNVTLTSRSVLHGLL